MKYKNVLVVTDNHFLFRGFKAVLNETGIRDVNFTFCCTALRMQLADEGLHRINIKKDYAPLIGKYDLIISLHCKQIFPAALVNAVRCINVHPGLNPYNRGWYPQVFSILNKKPVGATIHEMDEQIDHGAILVQRPVRIDPADTSLDVYNKVVAVEIDLLRENLAAILAGSLEPQPPAEEGNYNSVEDFNRLCELKLDEQGTMGSLLDKLRALTHGHFRNAYFIDPQNGKKVFVQVKLHREDD